METGSELSKTVATFIVQKILLDDSGLQCVVLVLCLRGCVVLVLCLRGCVVLVLCLRGCVVLVLCLRGCVVLVLCLRGCVVLVLCLRGCVVPALVYAWRQLSCMRSVYSCVRGCRVEMLVGVRVHACVSRVYCARVCQVYTCALYVSATHVFSDRPQC
jgi:hypothetical protein